MKLATIRDGSPDGKLVVVSQDGSRWAAATPVAPSLLSAIVAWRTAEPALRQLAASLEEGLGEPIAGDKLAAPLPRSWQWLDGSAFETHGELMQRAFGVDPLPKGRPLMYQGLSDRFYGPFDDVPFPDEADGIDFEGEYGVVVDTVPMGTTAADASAHIKLVVQINDWSLRTIAPIEMKTGFGWVQAKPACSMAPFAVTPDFLGDNWRDGRVCLPLHVEWNGQVFGDPEGGEMLYSFPELVAHAARTRDLVAGTIIGSGTVSNPDFAKVGSACISEVRAIEMIEQGGPRTEFMRFGDRVLMEARDPQGAAPFGRLDQVVVPAKAV